MIKVMSKQEPDLIEPSTVQDIFQIAPSFVIDQEFPCDDCGGTGRDIGALDSWDGEVCSRCAGSGQETVTKNYLAEALRIAGNPQCTVPIERAHLVAIIQYSRQVVGAAMCRPKTPAFKHEPVFSNASRYSRRANRTRKVIQIERRKRNVDISPQRT